MWVLAGTVFVASLIGSLHCVGMCGPFALLATADPDRKSHFLAPTMAYSFGRLVAYFLVGLLFGGLGMMINQTTSIATWQQTAAYLAGGTMIAVGLIALARQWGVRISLPKVATPLQTTLRKLFGRTLAMKPVHRAVAVGLLTSLMPCGWLYTFALTSAGTGSPLHGGILMVVFWAGTVPIMVALMLGVTKIGHSLQSKLPVIMATFAILVGTTIVLYRAPVIVIGTAEVPVNLQSAHQQIESADHQQMPCCQNSGQ